MKHLVYADYAATSPLSAAAREAMLPYLDALFANPSAVYQIGRQARRAVEEARDAIAACLGARPEEIYFTGCGTEGDNWAVKGMAQLGAGAGKRALITSAFEHHAVLHPCAAMEKEGFSVTYLPVHADGAVRPAELAVALRPDTALVSVMFANNEVGTVQPVAELAKLCHAHGVPLHTDAVQAAGHLPIDVHAMGIDLLSLSAHKFGGPKGTGVLYVRRGLFLPPLLDGGAQEQGRRSGTENVAGIVGMAAALQESCARMEAEAVRLSALRDRLESGLLAAVPQCRNSLAPGQPRLPGHLNLCFEGIEGDTLLLLLDRAGVCASSGSACTAGSIDPSHVLSALGIPPAWARGSLRLTLGFGTTQEDVDILLHAIPAAVARIRSLASDSYSV